MNSKQLDLLEPTERLEQALNAPIVGREEAWTQEMVKAVTDLEAALERHKASAEVPQGVFAEVDETRRALLQQVSDLRNDLNEILNQTAELHDRAKEIARLGKDATAGWAALGCRAADLVTGVRRLTDGEVGVVMESVNTDLGAGD
jgi:Ni,Fe-hydrogenase III large subunit